ncbi:DUF3461 family protein [Marinobacterium sedimentorum]|uniref:DUF3461 family protein n=1 Tax=Marinobacterium sedimentorum TaxID=2927804 RepID=UPI0020C65A3B|nr:DUF3461 family protein [Marinobacterium sedimentorum]MCP8688452.1 DUF3461 family protein [Marinobacterium sedimentorum]
MPSSISSLAWPRKSIPMQFRSGKKWDSLTDSSPTLQNAVIELNKLTTQPATLPPEDVKARFLEDLNHLETVVNSKIDELRHGARGSCAPLRSFWNDGKVLRSNSHSSRGATPTVKFGTLRGAVRGSGVTLVG